MKKKLIIILVTFCLIFTTGCEKDEKVNDIKNDNISISEVVSNINNDNEIVKYNNGTMNVKYSEHNNLENKEISVNNIEEVIKLLNYSEMVSVDFRGPSSITVLYTNAENRTFEFKIWSSDTFEFGELGIDCPQMNCTKFYKINSNFDLIKYFESIYGE